MGTGLGRGIASLLDNKVESDHKSENITSVRVDQLIAGRFQPRRKFEKEALQELADSLKQHGMVQPIVVRKIGQKYEIIAGERRFRAAQMAKMDEIPVIIKKMGDVETLQISIVENIQRENLNIVEEAVSYQRLMQEFKYTQEQLAGILAKKRSHVANILRINSLCDEIKEMLIDDQITFGHAKLLVGLDNAMEIAQEIIDKKMTVRAASMFIKKINDEDAVKPKETHDEQQLMQDFDIAQLEKALKEALGTNVKIKNNKIILEFADMEKLDEIMNKISA